MLEQQEFKGYFFVPGAPSEQLPGFLKYGKNSSIELDLFGRFDNYENPSSTEDNIILGVTSKGRKITLLNCFEKSRGMSFPGFAESSFSALYMFIGQHYNSPEEIAFESCSIEYSDFNTWLDISGFDQVKHDNEAREITIKYKQPENIEFKINDEWMGEINFYFNGPKYFKPVNKASIEQMPYLNITPIRKTTFKEFRKIYTIFSSFLALNYFDYPIVKSIVFTEAKEKKHEHDSDFNAVELYSNSKVKSKNYKLHANEQNFLIQYKPYEMKFPEFIQNWYILFNKIEASINILTECFMKRNSPIEFHFVSLVQALENLDRRITGKRNAYLDERLTNIVTILPPKVSDTLLYNEPDFIERIKNSRNFYTHYKDNHESNAAPLSELFILSEKLKIILISLVLKEIGFSNEETEKIILNKGVWLFNHVIKYDRVSEHLN
jgi:hypothetical protein